MPVPVAAVVVRVTYRRRKESPGPRSSGTSGWLARTTSESGEVRTSAEDQGPKYSALTARTSTK